MGILGDDSVEIAKVVSDVEDVEGDCVGFVVVLGDDEVVSDV